MFSEKFSSLLKLFNYLTEEHFDVFRVFSKITLNFITKFPKEFCGNFQFLLFVSIFIDGIKLGKNFEND